MNIMFPQDLLSGIGTEIHSFSVESQLKVRQAVITLFFFMINYYCYEKMWGFYSVNEMKAVEAFYQCNFNVHYGLPVVHLITIDSM